MFVDLRLERMVELVQQYIVPGIRQALPTEHRISSLARSTVQRLRVAILFVLCCVFVGLVTVPIQFLFIFHLKRLPVAWTRFRLLWLKSALAWRTLLLGRTCPVTCVSWRQRNGVCPCLHASNPIQSMSDVLLVLCSSFVFFCMIGCLDVATTLGGLTQE